MRTEPISPINLRVDPENPRISNPNMGQRDLIAALAEDQDVKLLSIAEHVLEHGLSPSELFIVMPLANEDGQFRVLEGNRRLCALKVLDMPSLLDDVWKPREMKKLRALSARYHKARIDEVECCVCDSREEARPWIQLKHGGQRGGAGVVQWGTQEKDRFEARSGTADPHQKLLDFVLDRGAITAAQREAVPVTTLKRMLSTPDVRRVLGLHLKKGEILLAGPAGQVAAAVGRLVGELASGALKVEGVYKAKQRQGWAEQFPADLRPDPQSPRSLDDPDGGEDRERGGGSGGGDPNAGDDPEGGGDSDGSGGGTSPGGGTGKPKPKPEPKTLIAKADLPNADGRALEVAKELTKLEVNRFPNAVAVLLRVLLDLSGTAYKTNHKPDLGGKDLKAFSGGIIDDLVRRGKLSKAQAKQVRSALGPGSLLCPGIDMMNAWVHEHASFPTAHDLRRTWHNLQPFVTAIWEE